MALFLIQRIFVTSPKFESKLMNQLCYFLTNQFVNSIIFLSTIIYASSKIRFFENIMLQFSDKGFPTFPHKVYRFMVKNEYS